MFQKSNILTLIFTGLLLLANTAQANDSIIRVVTSFSILEDLVNELGGNRVTVVNLVSRNSDAHMYQPKPSDAVAIAHADLVVFNGLEFEGWISRLINNSAYKNAQLIASNGVDALTHDNEVDPHAWQSFHNIRVYIHNITEALVALRPQFVNEFSQRQQTYLDYINDLEKQLLNQLSTIPNENRIVVTSHDAFGYLGREFGIRFLAPVGVSIEVDASAEGVASVINQIRKQQVKALFVENITNPKLLQRIASETGVAVGGRLYSDALSEADGPADTYLNMMRHNLQSLIFAINRS